MVFSVIIPVFNAEKTIIRCINSVKNQTFTNFEAILVNDGSSDHSEELCREYVKSDARFRCFSKPNGGVSSARNFGIEVAKGEYLVFLDSDDTYAPNYLEIMYQLVVQFPDCDHFWCGYKSIMPDAKTERTFFFSDAERISTLDRKDLMLLFQKQLVASPWTKVFKKSIVRQKGLLMPENLSLGEDLIFNLSYLNACPGTKIVIYNKPLYNYYCANNESLNHKYRSDLKEINEQLVGTMDCCLRQWTAPEVEWRRFYTVAFNMLEPVLYNLNHEKCTLSKWEKALIKRSVMDNEIFQKAVRNCECKINPLFKTAYLAKSVWMFDIFNYLVRLKGSVLHREKPE